MSSDCSILPPSSPPSTFNNFHQILSNIPEQNINNVTSSNILSTLRALRSSSINIPIVSTTPNNNSSPDSRSDSPDLSRRPSVTSGGDILITLFSLLESQQSQINSLISSNSSLCSDLQSTRSDLQSTRSDLQSTRSDLQFARSDIQSIRSDLQSSHIDLDIYRIRILKLESDISQLSNEISCLRSLLSALRSDYDNSISLICSLQSRINELLCKNNSYDSELRILKDQFSLYLTRSSLNIPFNTS